MMLRRPKRERTKSVDQRRINKAHAAFVRRCCNTRLTEPHMPGCVRPISRCADKIGYSSRAKAQAGIARSAALFGPMTPYRCDGCGAWHMGHPRSEEEGL